jgi:C-terminal processing protease CtpA/Prc
VFGLGGLGVKVARTPGDPYPQIVAVHPGGQAADAGVAEGDWVVQVDGDDVAADDDDALRARIATAQSSARAEGLGPDEEVRVPYVLWRAPAAEA